MHHRFRLPRGFQIMALAPVSAFELANATRRRAALRDPSRLRKRRAVGEFVRRAGRHRGVCGEANFDTLIVGRPSAVPAPSSRALIDFVREAMPGRRRIASICTGAFLLGEAGLLDGRRATTHWLYARELQRGFPRIRVEEDRIFIIDGPVWTSAGMSAGIDLALGMIEKDFGARACARGRPQARRLSPPRRRAIAAFGIARPGCEVRSHPECAGLCQRNLRNALSVEELAEAAHLSPRQFSRAFRAETGQSPAKAVEHLRVEAARLMMEQSRHPIDVVAAETGFADRERMRRAFLRVLGQPPQAIRRNAFVQA